MAQSISKNFHGPFWPLGLITVVTPGTPVNMMSLVDSGLVNAPEAKTSLTSYEYTQRAQQIMIQGFKSNGGNGLTNNSGNIYVMMKGIQGLGNRTDYGTMVICVTPGATAFLASAPLNRNVFSPYELFIDADQANDSALCMLIIQ